MKIHFAECRFTGEYVRIALLMQILTDEICSSALDLVRAKQIAETGDTVVLTAGIPSPNISGNVAGVSNIMKIAVID